MAARDDEKTHTEFVVEGHEPDEVEVEVIEDGKSFIFRNVLSPEEAAGYIEYTEELGFLSLEDLYYSGYRNNDRRILFNPKLAELLWERVKDHVPSTVFALNALWKPYGLNECFRVCKYDAGGIFGAHRDAHYAKNSKDRSLYTFMIYLNDVPAEAGGSTNFLHARNARDDDSHIARRVQPETGMALVFQHSMLHCGQELTDGLKYLCRSDVMFRQIEDDDGSTEAEATCDV